MAFIKFVISLMLGFFLVSLLDEKSKQLQNIPLIGTYLDSNFKDNKEIVIVFLMAIINFFL